MPSVVWTANNVVRALTDKEAVDGILRRVEGPKTNNMYLDRWARVTVASFQREWPESKRRKLEKRFGVNPRQCGSKTKYKGCSGGCGEKRLSWWPSLPAFVAKMPLGLKLQETERPTVSVSRVGYSQANIPEFKRPRRRSADGQDVTGFTSEAEIYCFALFSPLPSTAVSSATSSTSSSSSDAGLRLVALDALRLDFFWNYREMSKAKTKSNDALADAIVIEGGVVTAPKMLYFFRGVCVTAVTLELVMGVDCAQSNVLNSDLEFDGGRKVVEKTMNRGELYAHGRGTFDQRLVAAYIHLPMSWCRLRVPGGTIGGDMPNVPGRRRPDELMGAEKRGIPRKQHRPGIDVMNRTSSSMGLPTGTDALVTMKATVESASGALPDPDQTRTVATG
ncbi:hypothetical protein B0H19DRAFT_1077944 [Mycena capillaripes]|nr:hypothetical protein B0H19DRAFT_1077944 [Mycena capillaripes]